MVVSQSKICVKCGNIFMCVRTRVSICIVCVKESV